MEQLTSEQLSEWEAYDRLEPIGRQRDDYRTALLCSVVTNIARSVWHKKGTKPKMTTINDFLLQWGVESQTTNASKKQSVEEMKSILQAIAIHHRKK